MSYGVFKLNRCYSGPKTLIASAEEHGPFVWEKWWHDMIFTRFEESAVNVCDEDRCVFDVMLRPEAAEKTDSHDSIHVKVGDPHIVTPVSMLPSDKINVSKKTTGSGGNMEITTSSDSVAVFLERGKDAGETLNEEEI